MQRNHSVEAIEHSRTSIVTKASTSSRIGLIIFSIGAIYMITVSWLASWWVVPTMREIGLHGFGTIIMVWAVSAPLGALVVAIGAAIVASMETRRLWLWIISSVAVVIWLAAGSVMQIIPALFGIGGGLIMVFFLGVAWNWASARSQLSAPAKTASDLQMAGQVFFLIAAWNLCGLLGAPAFVLRPELTEKFNVSILAIGLGTTVLICLAIGWGFMFFGQRISTREQLRT